MEQKQLRSQAVSTDNWNASDYARSSSAQLTWAEELLAVLTFSGTENVLDIGCGDGKITSLIAEKVPYGQVVGIDRSQEMIALAQQNHKKPSLFFQQMDATAINLNERFDFIFSNAVLHWVEDHPAVLSGVQRHLKRGGRILLQMGGAGNAEMILSVISGLMTKKAWSPYYSNFQFPYFFYDTVPYKQWLAQAGLMATSIRLIPKDMIHQDIDELKGWLRTTWFPFTDCLPGDSREDFLNQIVEHYLKLVPPDSQGRTHVDMVRLQVEAIKK